MPTADVGEWKLLARSVLEDAFGIPHSLQVWQSP